LLNLAKQQKMKIQTKEQGMWFRRYAQAEGFKAAVQWRDSGKAIPESDEARAFVKAQERPRK
jgi:enoyl-CoA hydratase